jgi:hypothetical protein
MSYDNLFTRVDIKMKLQKKDFEKYLEMENISALNNSMTKRESSKKKIYKKIVSYLKKVGENGKY